MKHSIILKKFIYFFVALAAMSFTSCLSTRNINVAEDATSLEIIQMAQTAFDKGRTKDSLQYYAILLQRYGENPAIYVEAKYEIAHIYVKQKNYSKAKPMLDDILLQYDRLPPGTLPGAFKKMTQNDLKKIESK